MGYHSNMKNHILMNLSRYFIRYLKFWNGMTHADAKYYVDICMDPEEDYVDPHWGNIVDFKHPEEDTMSFIPLFAFWEELLRERRNQLTEEHRASGSQEKLKLPRGLKRILIVPVKRIRRNMISYDFCAMHQLWAGYNENENELRRMRGQPHVLTGQKPSATIENSRELFGFFFDLSKVERMKMAQRE